MKECEFCGEKFIPKGRRTKYCSNQHYKDCEVCGKNFEVLKPNRPTKCCSRKCADVLSTKQLRNGSVERKVEKKCELCGDIFKALNNNSRFCGKTHSKNCVVCGSVFNIANNHKPADTCSRKCAMGIANISDRTKKTKESNLKKYGVENVSQIETVKQKKIETLKKNFGVDNPSRSPEIMEKKKNTFIERYGVDNPYKNDDVRKKVAETNLRKYGVENVFKSEKFQKKASESILRKYGVKNIFQLPEVREKALHSNRNTISKLNKSWQKKINDLFGIEFDFEVKFGNYYADLGYGNVLLDINPTITHNSSYPYAHFFKYCVIEDCLKHKPLDSDYHQKRSLAAMESGFTYLQYFDWYDEEIFFSILRSKLGLDEFKVPARKTVVREIRQSEANRFLNENHLFGAGSKQSVCVGLFDDGGELVHVNTYGEARFNKNVEWEAIRSCSKMNYHVQGGFSKCEKYFLGKYAPRSMVSYVDLSFSDGSTDGLLDGWRLQKVNKPGAVWVNLLNNDYPAYIRDATARRVSADRLLGYDVGEKYPRFDVDGRKITNDDVLLAEGFVKVYDSGTMTFVYSC